MTTGRTNIIVTVIMVVIKQEIIFILLWRYRAQAK